MNCPGCKHSVKHYEADGYECDASILCSELHCECDCVKAFMERVRELERALRRITSDYATDPMDLGDIFDIVLEALKEQP